jgi:hypothetical protein
LGVGLTPPCKTWICFETSTEASEEEEVWGGHGQKTGRIAIEEEDTSYWSQCLTAILIITVIQSHKTVHPTALP